MKKYLVVLLVISIAFSMSGCAKKTESKATALAKASAVKTADSTPATEATVLLQKTLAPTSTVTAAEQKSTSPKKSAVKPKAVSDPKKYVAVNAVYPKPTDDYEKYLSFHRSKGLENFINSGVSQLFAGQKGKNTVCSPLSVYFALGMLAETTGGESQAQILKVLGEKDVKAVRSQAKTIWNMCYEQEYGLTVELANSFWMNDSVKYKGGATDTLAKDYYASSFKGKMGSKGYNDKLHAWMNEHTGGALKDSAAGCNFTPDTVLALVNTVFFNENWRDRFEKSKTKKQVFHKTTGDIKCNFMHEEKGHYLYTGEKFSALSKSLGHDTQMWFILPDKGTDPEELLKSRKASEFILADKDEYKNKQKYMVNLAVPKFNVSSDTNLIPILKKLGVKDVFSSAESDFSPLTDTKGLYVNEAQHSVKTMIDEEGCKAAALSLSSVLGGLARGLEEIDFTLDRPFIFAVTGIDDLPLFMGVVNNPV